MMRKNIIYLFILISILVTSTLVIAQQDEKDWKASGENKNPSYDKSVPPIETTNDSKVEVNWYLVGKSIGLQTYEFSIKNKDTKDLDYTLSFFIDNTDYDVSNYINSIKLYQFETVETILTINNPIKICNVTYINGSINPDQCTIYDDYSQNITYLDEWVLVTAQDNIVNSKDVRKELGIKKIKIKDKDKDEAGIIYKNKEAFYRVQFEAPILYKNEKYGNAGEFGIYVDGNKHHPYWNTSWAKKYDLKITNPSASAHNNELIAVNLSATGISGCLAPDNVDAVVVRNLTLDTWQEEASDLDAYNGTLLFAVNISGNNATTEDYHIFCGNAIATTPSYRPFVYLWDDFNYSIGGNASRLKWNATSSDLRNSDEILLLPNGLTYLGVAIASGFDARVSAKADLSVVNRVKPLFTYMELYNSVNSGSSFYGLTVAGVSGMIAHWGAGASTLDFWDIAGLGWAGSSTVGSNSTMIVRLESYKTSGGNSSAYNSTVDITGDIMTGNASVMEVFKVGNNDGRGYGAYYEKIQEVVIATRELALFETSSFFELLSTSSTPLINSTGFNSTTFEAMTGLTLWNTISVEPDYITYCNYSIYRPNGTQYASQQNASIFFEDYWNFTNIKLDLLGSWNASVQCQSNQGVIGNNVTFANWSVVDTTAPNVSISDPQTTTYTSTASIPLNFYIFDTYALDNCKYNIIGTLNTSNTTITACTNTTFSVGGDGTYQLYLFGQDTSGNERYQAINFTVLQPVVVAPATPGGGGGGGPVKCTKLTTNETLWTVESDFGGNEYDLLGYPNLTYTRNIVIKNYRSNNLTIDLECEDATSAELNLTEGICKYVNISKVQAKIVPNPQNPEVISFTITAPDSTKFGDEIFFNILATDNENCNARLNVNMRISSLGIINKKISLFGVNFPVVAISIFALIPLILLLQFLWKSILNKEQLGLGPTAFLVIMPSFFISILLLFVI